MYKIFRNAIPEEKMIACQNYMLEQEKNYKFEEGSDDLGKFTIKRIFNDELLSSTEMKELFFYEPLIKKIKNEIGPFTIINYFSGMINSFGIKVHRDGQSLGYKYDSKIKSKKIFKVMFYFDVQNKTTSKCLDVNFFDFELKNIFFNEKIFMKINYYYENYFRKKIMRSLNINLGDVIIMDNNTWHSASFIESRNDLIDSNFKCRKILLNFEVVNDQNIVHEHSQHVRNTYAKNKDGKYINVDTDLIDKKYFEVLKRNNISISNI